MTQSRKGGIIDWMIQDRDEVANHLYGKPYTNLTEEEKDKVSDKLTELKTKKGSRCGSTIMEFKGSAHKIVDGMKRSLG